jgi:hypothetical protein
MAADDPVLPERHTASQKPEDPAKIAPAVAEAIAMLKGAFPDQPIEALYWNEHYIAVGFEVAVELPPRGPVGDIDIRAREPVYLLFDRKRYPYLAPTAWSDRRDFPKTKLPHLNPTAPNLAANFCLHRGKIDAWFAEHGLSDLVDRVRAWLRDAARGRLVPDRDAFEPTRPNDPFGQAIFDPEVLFRAIRDAWMAEGGAAGFRPVAYELLDDDAKTAIGETGYTVRAATVVKPDSSETHREVARLINALADEEAYKKLFRKRLFGLLVWGAETAVTNEHFGELPDRLGPFTAWARHLALPLDAALATYLAADYHLFSGVPVTVAIRRPRRVLGADTDIELITFVILAGGDHWPQDGAWNLDAEVRVTDHRTPLTPAFARHLSSHAREVALDRTLIFGCGALGSKVGLHFARSGQTALTLVDPANVSPHNLVRHALGGRRIGTAKSESLKDETIELYPGQGDLGIAANTAGALDYLFGDRRAELAEHAHLLDATASVQVFNMLVDAELPSQMRVARAEIADQGRLGLLSIEGPDRNPRLDDLQAALFDSALDDPAVSRWLRGARDAREQRVGSGLEEIQIGLSCSSATMRLADEVVSFHAAALAGRVRQAFSRSTTESFPGGGLLYRVVLDVDGTARADVRPVAPVSIIPARNDPRWHVRFAGGLVEEMKAKLRRARPSETGGLLIGIVHAKRRIIYVTRLLESPRDSESSPLAFVRGVRDLPDAVLGIEDRSGGLVGYVGEWHSHPAGGPELSAVDMEAVKLLKRSLDTVPLPTDVIVITPRGVFPHVFEPTAEIGRSANFGERGPRRGR